MNSLFSSESQNIEIIYSMKEIGRKRIVALDLLINFLSDLKSSMSTIVLSRSYAQSFSSSSRESFFLFFLSPLLSWDTSSVQIFKLYDSFQNYSHSKFNKNFFRLEIILFNHSIVSVTVSSIKSIKLIPIRIDCLQSQSVAGGLKLKTESLFSTNLASCLHLIIATRKPTCWNFVN